MLKLSSLRTSPPVGTFKTKFFLSVIVSKRDSNDVDIHGSRAYVFRDLSRISPVAGWQGEGHS